MEQRLFTGARELYSSTRRCPNGIRIRIRMRDLVDPDVLRRAVDTTMQRYPYFLVELKKKDGHYLFADNRRPVVITPSLRGAELNSEAANYHMAAFAWQDNWIIFDIFHGLTDGTGAYEVIRTLLYYYCSERYGVRLKEDGIRLAGDEISEEEWTDPVEAAADLPVPQRHEMSPAVNLIAAAGLENDRKRTVYSVGISESEFMRFNIDHDGSPGTMVALFLCRAVSRLFPDSENPVRVALCINQRRALHAPLAHHSLVGGAILEYKEKLKAWPLDRQATAYRGMVFAQSTEETVLAGVNNMKALTQLLLSKETDEERVGASAYVGSMSSRLLTATVSYVGKADYKEAEKYIRDFRLWTTSTNLCIEISAVNGRFTLDILQPFSSPVVVNAFLKELEENGITYDLQDVQDLDLPNIRLPWSE